MRAVLIGYYGRGNLGDELMLACLHQWLKAQDIQLTVIAEEADIVAEQHHLPAVQNYPFLGQYGWVDSFLRGKAWRTLGALRDCDLVLCGGGDIIRDSVGWRVFSFQVEKLVAGLLLGKPVYLLNVGLTRPVTGYGRFVLRWLLPRCRGIIVRDRRSVEICREFGATEQVRLLPDIVRRLADLFVSATRPPKAEKPTVLVALHGQPNVYGHYAMTDSRIGTFAAALDALVDQYGMDIEFFPFQPQDHGGDSGIASEVQSKMRHASQTRILNWTIDLAEIAARFGRSHLVIAMRLHAAILAATYAVPCVLMPYDQKVVEFGEQAGIQAVLTPEMLDKPVAAKELLARAVEEKIAPAPLERLGDWMQLRLDAL